LAYAGFVVLLFLQFCRWRRFSPGTAQRRYEALKGAGRLGIHQLTPQSLQPYRCRSTWCFGVSAAWACKYEFFLETEVVLTTLVDHIRFGLARGGRA
jgi:hypothetical protein